MSARNPYEPPLSAVTDSEEPSGWPAARPISMALGTLGLALFWGTLAVVLVLVWRSLTASAPEPDATRSIGAYRTAAQTNSYGALALHLLGLVLTFATPRGKRTAGLILNGLPVLFLVGLAILGRLLSE